MDDAKIVEIRQWLLKARHDILHDIAEILTPYATAFRYPGDVLEPAPIDAEEAFELAEKLFSFVVGKFPEACVEVAK